MAKTDMDRELKKGSTELLILSLLEARARHGYDIGRQIESRSNGVVQLHVASLYPLLYRLEKRGWVAGRWVERAGERRRRYYRLTASGRKVLAGQKDTWRAFVASLGLGVGANTTIFSLVNEVLLHPLPVHDPSRLVSVFTTDAKNRERFQGFMATSYPNFRDYREQADNVFSGVAATVFAPLSLTSGGTPEQVFGEMVTGSYFDVLGVRAAIGQTFSFTAAED